ncbi:hypothetical protein [Endozoicomonas numazuensis]|nr:hypothetical protein [Endozoicomonas numazuensis]
MGERDMSQSYMIQSLQKATHVVNRLQREGYTVEKVLLGEGRPKIKISWHPRCREFGEPAVVSKGNNGSHYEKAMVEFEGCQLSWTVR